MFKLLLKLKKYSGFIVFAISFNVVALPIDWHGNFGVDTTRISDYRKGAEANSSPAAGSEVIPSGSGNEKNSSFQSYVFRLNPNIVVNDSASVFGEITTGYGRGGFYGDSSINRANNANGSANRNFGNAVYHYNTSSTNSNLVLNKFYMELYADTSTFVLGRQPINWGLGAVYNEGNNTWDRHTSVNDGVSAKFKLGNFKFTPHWAKINSAAGKTDAFSVTDYGIQAAYDNPDKDMILGVYYGKRKAKQFNSYYVSQAGSTNPAINMGDTNIRLIDIYIKKTIGKFSFSGEAPFVTGNIGHVFNQNDKASYGARAIILESKYDLNEKWALGLNGGQVSGSDGNTSKFGAMYLNPNYQIANVLFRYNYPAITDGNQSVWDSYITNVKYAKLFAKYSNEAWVWNGGIIYAVADKTAQSGGVSFDHERNQSFTATTSQENDLGYEVDAGFDFLWNPSVTISGNAGYLFTGKYFRYTNSNVETKAANMYVTNLSVAIGF